MLTNYIVYLLLRCLCILPFFLYKSFIVIHIFHRGDNNSNGGCSYGKVKVGNNCTGIKKNNEHPIQNHINSKEENHFVKNISKLYFVIYRLSGWIFWGKLHR